MSKQLQFLLVVFGIVAVSGFVGYRNLQNRGARSYAPDATFAAGARLAEFASNGVRVVVSTESDSQGQLLLRAMFTPTEHGFHVYSKDLDPAVTGGIGVATRMELLPNASVRHAGRLFADTAPVTHNIKELNIRMDVYPDGPVTLRLPIQFLGAVTNVAAQVAVSYMACKTDGVCLRPVEWQILDIQLASPRTGALPGL